TAAIGVRRISGDHAIAHHPSHLAPYPATALLGVIISSSPPRVSVPQREAAQNRIGANISAADRSVAIATCRALRPHNDSHSRSFDAHYRHGFVDRYAVRQRPRHRPPAAGINAIRYP